MISYSKRLKFFARKLRSVTVCTNAESLLWMHLRRKQINNIQFYRQRPLGNYIVDFYAPSIRLIIEVDGSQHFEPDYQKKDESRDAFLKWQGLKVLRFNNLDVLKNIRGVMEVIHKAVSLSKLS